MPTDDIFPSQIVGLATLLILNDEMRKLSTLREFAFFTTNETHRLIRYEHAFLWQKKEITGIRILAQSGVAEMEKQSLVYQALVSHIKTIAQTPAAKEIHQLNITDIEAFPSHVLWCPFLNKLNALSGGLIFFRHTPFSEAEIKMLRWLVTSYEFVWQVLVPLEKKRYWHRLKEKPYAMTLALCLAIVLLFPVRLSVLGTGTVIPEDPALINAPMQGVIKSFAVNPGEAVKAGQLLVSLDKTDLQAAADVATKDLSLTQTKLRSAINEGFGNPQSRAETPILQAQSAIDQARLDYTKELLAKTDLYAPVDGIVVFDSKEDWVGQPVRTGERILSVADPSHVQLKISIPVSNIIPLKVGAKGEFFLQGQFRAIPLEIKTLGYSAKLMPNRVLAYQLTAKFSRSTDKPQLGAQGTVRVYGRHVPFIYYLIRKPLQVIRLALGI